MIFPSSQLFRFEISSEIYKDKMLFPCIKLTNFYINLKTYINPTDPAVKPTARKKTNSSKSLGKEFTIRLR